MLAYSLWRKKEGFASILFSPDKVRGFEWDGLRPVLLLGVRAQNTSNQNFAIRSLAGNIYSVEPDNLEYVGNLSSFTTQIIGPNSQIVLNVRAELQLIGVANELIEAAQYKDFKKEILLKGMANVDNLQLPFSLQFSVGI